MRPLNRDQGKNCGRRRRWLNDRASIQRVRVGRGKKTKEEVVTARSGKVVVTAMSGGEVEIEMGGGEAATAMGDTGAVIVMDEEVAATASLYSAAGCV